MRYTLPKQSAMAWMVCGFAFFLPLTIVAAEGLWMLFVVVGLCLGRARHWRRVLGNPLLVPILLYVAWAAASVCWSVRPAHSAGHLHRLLFPLGIFVLDVILRGDGERPIGVLRPVLCFLAGACCLALYDLVRIPIEVLRGTALFDTANMRDPQMYMTALCLLFGLAAWALRSRRTAAGWGTAVVLNLAGLVLHFKRGVWFSFAAATALLVVLSRRWKLLVLLVVMALSMLLVPKVRERLTQLGEVTDSKVGGRYALWTEVGPPLFEKHPWGMGWCAVEPDDLQGYADYVQPHLDHLHNNLLQVRLETGWIGVGTWLLAMGAVVWVMAVNLRRAPPGGLPQALALGTLGGFAGLMMNGMVEYNVGDSEILMLICFLVGCASALRPDRKVIPES